MSYGITAKQQNSINAALLGITAERPTVQTAYSRDIRARHDGADIIITWFAGADGEHTMCSTKTYAHCVVSDAVAYHRTVRVHSELAAALTAVKLAKCRMQWADTEQYTNAYARPHDVLLPRGAMQRAHDAASSYVSVIVREITLAAITEQPLPIPFAADWLSVAPW